MDGHSLVPRDTPDPDGDQRFAERAFPLLEPLVWAGERHRGGYGVHNPGSATISLGLIFGPWDQFVSAPRLAVTVGSVILISVTEPQSSFMLRPYLVATREELLQAPQIDPEPARFTAHVEIDGAVCAFDALGDRERWVARGSWNDFEVFIHAIAIDPDRVRLRVTANIPPG